MDYCMSKILSGEPASWEPRVKEALAGQGFGVLTEIDVEQTLRKKLNIEIGPYKILGACNPAFAKEALDLEPRIGVMLPCNVVLRQLSQGKTEISFIDPLASMAAVDNPGLKEHAAHVKRMLKAAFDILN